MENQIDEEKEISSYTEFYYNELFPSAIMFGMSSTEFWEEEPQLYWAYRFSFIKKEETEAKKQSEQLKLGVWLNGIATNLATTVSLANSFGKGGKTFPSYDEFFNKDNQENNSPLKEELNRQLDGVEKGEERGQIEFNFWARI